MREHALMSSRNALRPFLKWAGGKSKLLPQLLDVAPRDFDAYFEPFVGGGALFFVLSASRGSLRSHLSDSNEELVNAYTCVRDSLPELIGALQELEEEYLQAPDRADSYYRVRSDERSDPVHRAARLLFLNKTCFNGLYRVNRSGRFNVPHGRYANPTICDIPNLKAASAALQGSKVTVEDFGDSCRRAGSGDFVYFDPPYQPVSETSRFTSYTAADFTWDDQVRLADVALEASSRGAAVLISNSGNADIEALYRERGLHVAQVTAARSINSDPSRRGPVHEILAASYEFPASISSPKKNLSQISRSSSSTTLPVLTR